MRASERINGKKKCENKIKINIWMKQESGSEYLQKKMKKGR